jgi:hypothetical protein
MPSQSHRRTLPLATALLALALTTPAVPAIAAGNTSAEPPPPNFPTAVPTRPGALTQPADTHAPLIRVAANARAHDLRAADDRDAAVSARTQDLRHLQARGSYTPGSIPAVSSPSRADTETSRARVGAYTPGSIPAVSYPSGIAAPAAKATARGNGVGWTTIGLGIAGGLLAIGGIVGIARRSRRIKRVRVTA